MTSTVEICGHPYPAYEGGVIPEDHVVFRGAVMDIDEMLAVEEALFWLSWDASHEDDGRGME